MARTLRCYLSLIGDIHGNGRSIDTAPRCAEISGWGEPRVFVLLVLTVGRSGYWTLRPKSAPTTFTGSEEPKR